MCRNARPGQSASQLEIEFDARFHRAETLNYKKHFENGHDHSRMPVICDKAPDKILMALWGLVPSWAPNISHEEFYKIQSKEKKDTLMARIEDIENTSSYKSFINNRCIILLESFKEWQHVPGAGKVNKIPYEIKRPDERMFAVAGLYSVVNGKLSFTLLTTEANQLMSEIHNTARRMPVVLNKLEEKTWLGGAPKEQFYDRNNIALRALPEGSGNAQDNVIYL